MAMNIRENARDETQIVDLPEKQDPCRKMRTTSKSSDNNAEDVLDADHGDGIHHGEDDNKQCELLTDLDRTALQRIKEKMNKIVAKI